MHLTGFHVFEGIKATPHTFSGIVPLVTGAPALSQKEISALVITICIKQQ